MSAGRDAAGTGCSMVSRRLFLAGLGATATVAACSGQGVSVFQRSGAAEPGRPTPPVGSVPDVDRTLVVLEFGGGNDSLSTVVPASGVYRDLRPTTAVEDPIELDAEIGLHPELVNVADLYRRGSVAIVEGLGIAAPDLSHFVSMRRWWDGTEAPDQTGWLGRYLDAAVGYEQVLAGVSIGPGPSPALLGNSSFVVGISDATGLASGFPSWVDDSRDFAGAWSGFAPAEIPVAELDPIRRAIAATAQAQIQLLAGLDPLTRVMERIEVDTYSLEGQLALAGALTASDVRPKVVYVHGNVDFDTHENQLSSHADLMGQFDRGLGHFFEIVDKAGLSDQVLVMTASEFGRRPRDNDGGTDHGTAASHFVIGSQVAGGRFGESPSLTRLDEEDNLRHTVDFRSLYASVLDGWFEAGSADLLGSDYERLPLFG